jgi:hypothetical protein
MLAKHTHAVNPKKDDDGVAHMTKSFQKTNGSLEIGK